MPKDRKPEQEEIDANDVIREYVEFADSDDQVGQTKMEWYEQAKQETTVPSGAVVAGGDVDAAWDQADVGEETVGGTTPTPDQDIVDEIGRAVGVSYEDAEPLHTTENWSGATRSAGSSIRPPRKTSRNVIKVMTHHRPLRR